MGENTEEPLMKVSQNDSPLPGESMCAGFPVSSELQATESSSSATGYQQTHEIQRGDPQPSEPYPRIL